MGWHTGALRFFFSTHLQLLQSFDDDQAAKRIGGDECFEIPKFHNSKFGINEQMCPESVFALSGVDSFYMQKMWDFWIEESSTSKVKMSNLTLSKRFSKGLEGVSKFKKIEDKS